MGDKVIETNASAKAEPIDTLATNDWPALPTETEIYILPDGQVVVADLPVELLTLLAQVQTNSQAVNDDAESE